MSDTQKNKKPNVPNLRFPGFEGEWEKVSIGQICTIIGGGTPDTNTKKYWNGDIQWFTPSEVGKEKYVSNSNRTISIEGLKNSSAKLLPPYSILLSSRATVGECSINLKECCTNQGFQSAVPNVDITSTEFLYYRLLTHKHEFIKKACGSTFLEISAKQISKLYTYIPERSEQKLISSLLSLIDQRITIQNRVIEDLKVLKAALCEFLYDQSEPNHLIGEIIEQTTTRNRKGENLKVLSVSNQQGFIDQSEQFEGRTIASQDTSSYKIVSVDDFAYNPARINVGSIARLKGLEKGIVSPMYVCFHCKKGILPGYLEAFFDTDYFFLEMEKRLEGSVRMCLSYDGLCNIPIAIPDLQKQNSIERKLHVLKEKIQLEESIHKQLSIQKQCLLSQLFI